MVLLSRHLLAIGACLTDDDFLRLAHEMEHFLEESGAKRRNLGTVLTFSADRGRPMLFQGVFDFVDVRGADRQTGPGRSVPTNVTSPTRHRRGREDHRRPGRDELRVGCRSNSRLCPKLCT